MTALPENTSEIFFDQFWNTILMFLKEPLMIVILILVLIVLPILRIVVKHHGTRHWTKVRTRARLEEQDKYKQEKKHSAVRTETKIAPSTRGKK